MSELTGYRCWLLEKDENDDWILGSQYWDTQWGGPLKEACCRPRLETSHGLYAVKSPRLLDGWIYDWVAVWGQVRLLGHVIEGDRGYRAETQMIQWLRILGNEVDTIPLLRVVRKWLGSQIGVPCIPATPRTINDLTELGSHVAPRNPMGPEAVQPFRKTGPDQLRRSLEQRYECEVTIESKEAKLWTLVA